MVKIKQDLLNSIKEFTLMDDPFMTKVFEDDIERTQLILRIILENDTIVNCKNKLHIFPNQAE